MISKLVPTKYISEPSTQDPQCETINQLTGKSLALESPISGRSIMRFKLRKFSFYSTDDAETRTQVSASVR